MPAHTYQSYVILKQSWGCIYLIILLINQIIVFYIYLIIVIFQKFQSSLFLNKRLPKLKLVQL